MADDLRAPKRKTKHSPEKGFAAAVGSALWRSLRRQPALSAMMIVFGGLASVTVVNALVMQGNRHPAMLFSTVSDPKAMKSIAMTGKNGFSPPKSADGFVGRGKPTGSAVAQDSANPFIRDLQSELAKRGLYTGTIDGMTGEKTAAAIRLYEEKIGLPVTGEPSPLILRKLATNTQEFAPEKPVDDDPLRGVIQESTPSSPADINKMKKVQKALNALDFGPLTEDGLAGAATREAIERFERSRKLTPTGEAAGKTLAALQKASGITLR
jgi:peptidoglycan hydrolase-like protein with peptidoglycan-binding domain